LQLEVESVLLPADCGDSISGFISPCKHGQLDLTDTQDKLI